MFDFLQTFQGLNEFYLCLQRWHFFVLWQNEARWVRSCFRVSFKLSIFLERRGLAIEDAIFRKGSVTSEKFLKGESWLRPLFKILNSSRRLLIILMDSLARNGSSWLHWCHACLNAAFGAARFFSKGASQCRKSQKMNLFTRRVWRKHSCLTKNRCMDTWEWYTLKGRQKKLVELSKAKGSVCWFLKYQL